MMRKTFDKAFKARVALEAIKGEKTLQQIAQEFEVHTTQVTQWKKQALDNLGDLFERANKKKEEGDSDAETDKLYKQIGQLSVENEFLKKSTGNGTVTSRSYRAWAPWAVHRPPMRAFADKSLCVLLPTRGRG